MIQFFLHIKDGKVYNRDMVATAFKSLQDGRYFVKIAANKNRSNPQNRYYHGCMLPMVLEGLQDAGFNEIKDVATVHELLKKMFLERKLVSEKTGDEIIIPGSTAKLSTTEFNVFIDEVIRWASEYLSIQIPLPNEQMDIFNGLIATHHNDIQATIIEKL